MVQLLLAAAIFATCVFAGAQNMNSTYFNPVLPGWHSDPTCTQINGTFFCATSTFNAFPGLPVYSSHDLIHWNLVSNAWNRESQLPGINYRTTGQQNGFYAPNLRHHNGTFYMTSVYVDQDGIFGTVFNTSNPFNDSAWSDPLKWEALKYLTYDPDLFWDDDGTVYLTSAGALEHGIVLQKIDLQTGDVTDPISIWNGTSGAFPEGPHMYKKDGYYYLTAAEGGTYLGHMQTIARSRNINGPYEDCPYNPILTNANTSEYFQTVGHADFFKDSMGKQWGMALCTRSGPRYQVYPMGREACLFPVTWNEDEWPITSPVTGVMNGWALPGTGNITTKMD